MDLTNANMEIQRYFHALPPYIQETIQQTDIDIQSLDDLKDVANHLSSYGNTYNNIQ